MSAVGSNVTSMVGVFEKTLPHFCAGLGDETISILQVDCDIYSGTKTIFECLGARIVPGAIIIFDEYFNFPDWRNHAIQAFAEFVAEHGVNYEYIGYVPTHQQVAVRIL